MGHSKFDISEKGFNLEVNGLESDDAEPRDNDTQLSQHYEINEKEHEHGDIVLRYVHNPHENDQVPPEVERRLAFKADIYLFTFMAWCYCLQFADKTVLSGSSMLGITADLQMEGDMYSWAGSSFYYGYLVGAIPMAFILQIYPVSKVVSVCYFAWAVVLTLSAASQNYGGFIATRVILGFLESVVTSAFTIITTQWFPRNSHFTRICYWFGCNGLGTILANSIAYGIYRRSSTTIAPWRCLILIMGLITVVSSIAFYFHVPDTPVKAWFLSEEERAWQVQVIREHNGGAGYGTGIIKKYQVKEAILDPATWLAAFHILLGNVSNGATTNFASLLLKGMGFESTRDSLLMTLPGGGIELVGCVVTGFASKYIFHNNRMVYCVTSNAVSVICLCLLAWGPNNASQLAGNYISSWVGPISMIAFLSNIGSNSAGHTKKLVTNGIFLACYAIGNLCGPYSFRRSEAPYYTTGKTTMAATTAASFILTLLLVSLNLWRNWQRNKKNEKLPASIENPEFADLTDLENPEFRYAM